MRMRNSAYRGPLVDEGTLKWKIWVMFLNPTLIPTDCPVVVHICTGRQEEPLQVMYGPDTDLNWWLMAQTISSRPMNPSSDCSDSCPAATAWIQQTVLRCSYGPPHYLFLLLPLPLDWGWGSACYRCTNLFRLWRKKKHATKYTAANWDRSYSLMHFYYVCLKQQCIARHSSIWLLHIDSKWWSFLHSKNNKPQFVLHVLFKYVLWNDKNHLSVITVRLWDCFLNDVLVITNGCLMSVESVLRALGPQGGGLCRWGAWYSSMCGEGIHKSFWVKEETEFDKVYFSYCVPQNCCCEFNRIISRRQSCTPLLMRLSSTLLFSWVEDWEANVYRSLNSRRCCRAHYVSTNWLL